MKKNFNLVTLVVVVMMVVLTACGNKAEQSNGTPTGSISTNKNNSALNNVDDTITNTIKEPDTEPDTEPGEETNNPEAEPTGKEEPVLTPDVDTDISVTPSDIKENPVVFITPSGYIPEPTRMPGATATPTPIRNNAVPTEAPVVVPTRTPVSGGVPTKAPTKAPVVTKTPVATSTPKATSTPTPTPTPHIVSYILVVDKKVATELSNDGSLVLYYFEHDTAPDYPYITKNTRYTAEDVKRMLAEGYDMRTIFLLACDHIPSAYHYDKYYVIGTEEIIVDVDYVYPNGYYGIVKSDGCIHCYKIKDTVGCIYSDGRVVRY